MSPQWVKAFSPRQFPRKQDDVNSVEATRGQQSVSYGQGGSGYLAFLQPWDSPRLSPNLGVLRPQSGLGHTCLCTGSSDSPHSLPGDKAYQEGEGSQHRVKLISQWCVGCVSSGKCPSFSGPAAYRL